MNSLNGQVVLITGAGRGLGRQLAVAFAKCGARVAANDITPINLDETMAQVAEMGGRTQAYLFDVAKKMPVQAMVAQILDEWGRIDILINHAEVEPHDSILEMDEWDWQRTLDVNLSAPFWLIQVVGRIMREQGGGVIIHIAPNPKDESVLDKGASYIASKMGLIGLTRAAAYELAGDHVRINVVCPVSIATGKVSTSQADDISDPEFLKGNSPNQADIPRDAIELILYLCRAEAAHLNGQVFSCNLRVG